MITESAEKTGERTDETAESKTTGLLQLAGFAELAERRLKTRGYPGVATFRPLDSISLCVRLLV